MRFPKSIVRSQTSLLALSVLLFLGSCTSEKQPSRTFFRMDTMVKVVLVSRKDALPLAATWASADSLLENWEQRFSQNHPESEVLKINNRKSDTVSVSQTLAEMIQFGLAYGDSTNGKFDLTILPIKELWGLGEHEIQRVPPSDSLEMALAAVDYQKVRVSASLDSVMFLNRRTKIDLGGIAKGFALMELDRLLKTAGYRDFLIAAGDILVSGHRADGKPWRIGIQHPRDKGELCAGISLDTGAVFTSGDYERYWVDGEKRYHHIFDPSTGYSCGQNQSLTIWSIDPLRAKALSTGLFCLPADSILPYVEQRNDLECLVVDQTGRMRLSSGWQDDITIY